MSQLGKIVKARTGTGELFAVGRVVAESEQPTLTLVTPHGEIVHWNADLCEQVVDEGPVAEALIPMPNFSFPLAKIPRFW